MERTRLAGIVVSWLLLMLTGLACAGDSAEGTRPTAPVVETDSARRGADAEAPATGGEDADFASYTNERFGFSVAYPSGVLSVGNRPQNDDGIVLASASGDVMLRAFASHNATERTRADVLETARDDFAQIDAEEGRQAGTILWGHGTDGRQRVERVELHEGDVYTMALSYPEDELSDSMVERIISSFEVDARAEVDSLVVQVALLADPAGEGQNEEASGGPQRGCDRVVMVDRRVPRTGAPLTAALTELFSLERTTVDGLRHFIGETNETLAFDRATVQNGTASIYLTGELSGLGGVCDNPRARIQIEETALQFPTVDSVALYLNDRPTDLQPDGRGDR